MIGVKESQSIARKPNSKAPHLAFPLGRGSEAHHAMLLKL